MDCVVLNPYQEVQEERPLVESPLSKTVSPQTSPSLSGFVVGVKTSGRPTREEAAPGETVVDSPGYKRVFSCGHNSRRNPDFLCGCKFQSLKALRRHTREQHSKCSGRLSYDVVFVDGNYIAARRATCHTKTITFSRLASLEESESKTVKNSCMIRNCPVCHCDRERRVRHKVMLAVREWKRFSVLTLSYKGHHALSRALKLQLERHIRNFIKRLIRKYGNFDYFRALEVKRKSDGWYYHYHFLMDMPFVRQDTLSDMWHDVTGNSYVVWIESLKDEQGRAIGYKWARMNKTTRGMNAALYVAKYVSKPAPSLTDEEYALYLYKSRFSECRSSFTSISRRNSSILFTAFDAWSRFGADCAIPRTYPTPWRLVSIESGGGESSFW